MRAKIFVAGVSIAALLGAAACTTTDPYRSTPVRNNTFTSCQTICFYHAVTIEFFYFS